MAEMTKDMYGYWYPSLLQCFLSAKSESEASKGQTKEQIRRKYQYKTKEARAGFFMLLYLKWNQ